MILVKPSFDILTDIDSQNILKLIEQAGRICYKSEDKITDESAKEFCRTIIKRGHLSVIEHFNISVKFVCNRGVSHELVRHRLASYSQESTRYCNYKSKSVTFVIPPWHDIAPGNYSKTWFQTEQSCATTSWATHLQLCEQEYLTQLSYGMSPQQARGVLPIDLKTEIVMTANLREWRHVFNLRCSKAAHPQMREIMIPLREEMKNKISVIFDDLT